MENQEQSQIIQAKALLQELRAGTIDTVNLFGAIHDIGHTSLEEARPDIERLLDHEYSLARAKALHVLCLYYTDNNGTYWEKAVNFLFHDPAEYCRRQGAFVLGILKRDTQDQRTLELLAQVAQNTEEDESVREVSYSSMRSIILFDREEEYKMLDLDFELDRDANWDFVRSYLPQSS